MLELVKYTLLQMAFLPRLSPVFGAQSGCLRPELSPPLFRAVTEQCPPSLVLQSLLGLFGQQPLLGFFVQEVLNRPNVALGLSENQRLWLLDGSRNVNRRRV